MSTTTLLSEDLGSGVRMLTLNRPTKRNAIDRELFGELIEAFEELDRDAAVRVAIVTGAGSAFCSGVDLADVGDAELPAERRRTGVSPPSVLLSVKTPVIAAVNGACTTGGLELALACDLIIASDAASFADTHLQLGLIPSWGGTALLPAAVGTRRAKAMILSGSFISAQEALAYGLVAAVVAPDQLRGHAVSLAQRIAAIPRAQVQRLLGIYDDGDGLPRSERQALERRILLESQVDPSRAAAGAQ
jgi:enoyl-CoA hydratase